MPRFMPRPDRIMERNNTNNNNHNGSGNGFLLGVIVGVLLTLLFTTKRGRLILKDVMEKGVEKFSNLEQLMHEAEDDFEDDIEEGDDYIPAEPIPEPEPMKIQKIEKKTEVVTQAEEKTPPSAKPVKEESPKFLDEAKTEVANKVDETEETTHEEEKPKTTPVKRLFRGLRKKG